MFTKIFHTSLKSLVASLVAQYPREILMSVTSHLNQSYENLKDPLLDHFVAKYPVKTRENLWETLTAIYKNILHPLLQAINAFKIQPELLTPSTPQSMEQVMERSGYKKKALNYAIRAYQQKNLYWPKPQEINFLQLDKPNDVAIISCKIGEVCIPYAIIDTGSDLSVISENVAKHLDLKID
jgi:hypothetical protein